MFISSLKTWREIHMNAVYNMAQADADTTIFLKAVSRW